LRRFGAQVTIVQDAPRLLAREEPRVSELLTQGLAGDGIDVRVGVDASSVTPDGRGRTVLLSDGTAVSGQELLVATGRAPRGGDLGLEALGVEVGFNGVVVDERCRAGEGIWAIGDVTGVMPFTHVAKYQARVACADITGSSACADYGAVPRVVFCDPEVAAVGLTETGARERGIEVATARVVLSDEIARPWTYERDPRGELGVLADRRARVLVGAWAVAPLAGEWIHYASLAVKARIPLDVLRDSVAQFPTYCEGYLRAIEALEL
jgi:dihydrolipoamide dehydrogenase